MRGGGRRWGEVGGDGERWEEDGVRLNGDERKWEVDEVMQDAVGGGNEKEKKVYSFCHFA